MASATSLPPGDPPFPLPDELQHFYRITWLLGHPTFKDIIRRTGTISLPTIVDPRLPLLKSLAILFVRKDEVVTVMPCRNGTEVVVNANLASNSKPNPEDRTSTHRMVTDNYRWSNNRPEDNDGTTNLSVTAHTIDKESKKIRFDSRAAVPTYFKDHVSVVIDILKKYTEYENIKATEKKSQDKHKAIQLELCTYITRACLPKIAARAAFHCISVAGAIGIRDAKLYNREDFSCLLPPPRSWEKQMRCKAYRLGDEKKSFDNSLDTFINTIGIAEEKDDLWWESSCPTLDKYSSELKTYALERRLKKYVDGEEKWDEGFYLVAASRRAYHEAFAARLATCLFYLQLLVKGLEATKRKAKQASIGSIAKPLAAGSSTEMLLIFCRNSLMAFYEFVSQSRILGIHLEWYLASTKNKHTKKNKTKENETGKENENDWNDQDDDQDDDDDQVDPGEDQNKYKFAPGDTEAKSIVRWLRLLTEHQHSVALLTEKRYKTLLRLLRVHVLNTAMSTQDELVDNKMEHLEKCLTNFVGAERDRKALIHILQEPLQYRTAHGTFHSEAILASLYLLSNRYQNLHHPAVPKGIQCEVKNLYPFLCAVSKKCCPVCTTIYWVLSRVLNSIVPDAKGIAISGTHSRFSPCRLPPWFPRDDALLVIKELEEYLSLVITEKVKEIHHRRNSSTLSVGDSDRTGFRAQGFVEFDEPEALSIEDSDSDKDEGEDDGEDDSDGLG